MVVLSPDKREEINGRFSENALKMMKKRYLIEQEDGAQETPVDLFARLARALAAVEKNYGKDEESIQKIEQDFFEILSRKEYTPGGRTIRNAGASTSLVANCIVLPIHDSMESIFQTMKDAALLQQAGSGLGFDLSEMRPAMSPTKKSQGVASGPVSFLRVYDAAFGTIKQQSRNGANMSMLRVDHPDVLDFIDCKQNEGDIRNFNITVTVTDEFMEKLISEPDSLWECQFKGEKMKPHKVLRHPNGSVYEAHETDITVRELFDKLVEGAWQNGEPGIAFVDTWNRANPLPDLGPLAATNPCVTGDTLVSTEKGLLRMEELVQEHGQGGLQVSVDERVPVSVEVRHSAQIRVTAAGELREEPTMYVVQRGRGGVGEASRAWRTGVKPVYKLKTRSGYAIEATKDHKIFTPQGKVPLGELKRGDKVLIQSQEGQWSSNYGLPFEVVNEVKGKNGRTYKFNLPAKWSRELGLVLGWLVGDGWVRETSTRATVGFTFAQGDRAVMEGIKATVNEWRNLQTKEILRHNGVFHLIYGSRDFVAYLQKLGVKAVRAREKEVPSALWKAPREAVVGFLQALFSADGAINIDEKNQTRYIRLTSKSEALLKQVQVLLANFGIRSMAYNRSRKPSIKMGYQNDGVLFELQISKANIPVFLEKVGFIGDHYRAKAEKLKAQVDWKRGYYLENFEEEVAEIAYAGRKTVYDLTEETTHSFVANGLVISNCGEQALHPYDNCNLGSLNLAVFVKEDRTVDPVKQQQLPYGVDWERLRTATRTAVRLMDNVIDLFDFPVEQVTELAKKNRRIGLGIMGFADLLFQLRVGYNTEEGLEVAESVMGFINRAAYEMSQELAEEKGAFPNFEKSIFAGKDAPHSFAQETGIGKKMRNAALTTVAPTGTISMMFDTSSGIEPNFALAYIKQDKDGNQYRYFNRYFQEEFNKLGLSEENQKRVMDEVVEKGSIQHLTELPEELRKIFVAAMDITGRSHMAMQAVFQKHVDNSISKTINFPNETTREEIGTSFIDAWKMGCKSATVYREGSRTIQILNIGNGENIVAPTERPSGAPEVAEKKSRTVRPRPEVLSGKTYRMKTGYGNLYITVNSDEKGDPFEVFATIGKSGGFFQEQSEAITRLISLAFRSGIPPEEVIDDLSGIRGPMPIFTDKGTVLSLPDAIGKVLQEHLGAAAKELEDTLRKPEKQEALPFVPQKAKAIANFGFMPGCPDCGAPLQMAEGCISCTGCGFSRCS